METASLLELPVNAPMGDIKRMLTGSDGVLIYYNEVSYRGDMVRFEIDLDMTRNET
jgi:GntR family transcriptional regulator